MEIARVFNEKAGIDQIMSASAFEKQYKGNKQLGIVAATPLSLNDFEFVSPDTGEKLWHRNSSAPMGATQSRDACFYSQQNREGYKQEDEIKTAIEKNKPILVNLNIPILSSDKISFNSLHEDGAKSLQSWLSYHQGRHISVSVTSAKQTRDTIKNIGKTSSAYLQDNVFVSHKGGVIPYTNFYLRGSTSLKTKNLFNNLQAQTSGVFSDDNMMLGFPRLHKFEPSKNGKKLNSTTIQQPPGMPIIGTILINAKEACDADPSLILEDEISSHDRDTFILACPKTKINVSQDEWKILEWEVHDPSVQIDTNDPA